MRKVSSNRWTSTSADHYVCRWLQSDTERFSHFSITEYSGLLVGDDSFIHQDITKTTCVYQKFSCIPSEMPSSAIVWSKVSHDPSKFLALGNYTLHKLDDFILIPQLGIGGAIQSSTQDGQEIQLDNGFLCTLHPAPHSPYNQFRTQAANFIAKAKPSIATGVVQAHIAAFLEMQRDHMMLSWDQLCRQEAELDSVKRWMLRHFPASSAQWLLPDSGYRVDVEGDGLLLSQCTAVYHYQILWNRTLHNQCYTHFPVYLPLSSSYAFLDVLGGH